METNKETSRKVPSDVLVGPSLPPFVEGQLRCFLYVSVGEVKWMSRIKPPSQVHVCFKWWGQQNNNILLEPKRTGSHRSTKSKCAVKYPIRSGPKQFSSYLKDMGTLNLDVLANSQVIGQAQIKDIGHLCNSRPLQGFYPVTSVVHDQCLKEIASIFISLAFHSVASSFNMTSSTIPTTDMSSPLPKSSREPSDDSHIKHLGNEKGGLTSTGKTINKKKQKEVKISSAAPEKIEYSVYDLDEDFPSFVVGPGKKTLIENIGNTEPAKERAQPALHSYQTSLLRKEGGKTLSDKGSPESNDVDGPTLLHDLIERGKSLRNRMLLSSLDSPDPIQRDPRAPTSDAEVNLFKDIFHQIDEDDLVDPGNHPKEYSMDKKLVEMVTGEEEQNLGRLIQKLERDSDGSLNEGFSDSEDPIREDSLLTDLFYTAKQLSSEESSVILSDDSDLATLKPRRGPSSLEDQGNQRPKKSARKKHLAKMKSEKGARPIEGRPSAPGTSMNDDDNNSTTYLNPDSIASHDETTNSPVDGKDEPENAFVKTIEKLIPEGMDLDAITVLARARFARVIVHNLEVKDDDVKIDNSTFFIECEFPLNSRESSANYPAYNEVIRCASSKLAEKSIIFNHRSVFPVHFDGATLSKWWDKNITFKVFSRLHSSQQHVLIGEQSVALRQILLVDDFAYHANIEIVGETRKAEKKDKHERIDNLFGELEVSIELGSDKEEIKHRKTKLGSQADRHQGVKFPSIPAKAVQSEVPLIRDANVVKPIRGIATQQQIHSSEAIKKHLPNESVALYSLLFIPGGRIAAGDLRGGLAKTANAYLVCRMLWEATAVKSRVCWSTADPEFQFIQTTPLMLSAQLLDRAEKNFMVVEVWNKSMTADDDEVIGIVKLPLHPFYLSYKDRGIVKTLLKSQFPVIATDGLVQIKNLFSGAVCGHLQVLLALGTQDQVTNLLKLKKGSLANSIDAQNMLRPARDHDREAESKVRSGVIAEVEWPTKEQRNSVDHLFVVSIENAKNIEHSKEGGNADCFVQYQFPEQKHASKAGGLIWHKTQTSLLVENPVFGFSKKHFITLPLDTPVQSFILKSFEHHTSLKAMGIPIEVWQRSYYPNIRDCLLYKTSIPMAKVHAMITMRKQKDMSAQSFQLQLSPLSVPDTGEFSHSKATLNVGISYQLSSHQKIDLVESKSPCVCISVSVLRACGLKSALLSPSSREVRSQSLPPSGLNTFVKTWLSFLGVDSCRVSPAIARSFAPTFSFHVDFPVNVVQESVDEDDHEENSTLAYHLESGFLEVELYHKPLKSGFMSERNDYYDEESSALLIGRCSVPLLALLCHNTGVKGWHPITVPRERYIRRKSKQRTDADELQKLAGGLELAVKFGKETDRELVINTARGVGWSPLESIETHEESFQDFDQQHAVGLNALLSIDKFWVPDDVIEKAAGGAWNDLRIYCRYKFYDYAAVVSRSIALEEITSSDLLTADLIHKKSFLISASSALSWYLREESFECQIWLKVVNEKANASTKKSRDRLLGSAHIDASGIAKSPSLKGSVSGLYPIYKTGADYLGRSCVRASLRIIDDREVQREDALTSDESLNTGYPRENESGLSQSDDVGQVDEPKKGAKMKPERRIRQSKADELGLESNEKEEEKTGVECRIIIEEALHLPCEENNQGSSLPPSTYMAYQLTPFKQFVCTPVVFHSTKPCWSFEKVERLDPARIPNKVVIFKLFKKTSPEGRRQDTSKDSVIGTTNVDISLLLAGFRQIHGWYNITDFAGQNVGQVKVGIIPGKPVATSPSSRYFSTEVLAEKMRGDLFWGSSLVRALDFQDSHQGRNDIPADTASGSHATTSANPSREPTSDVSVEPSSSTSVLFHRLRDQMSDLDNLTKELQNRLKTYDQQDERAYNEASVHANNANRSLSNDWTVRANVENNPIDKSRAIWDRHQSITIPDLEPVAEQGNAEEEDNGAEKPHEYGNYAGETFEREDDSGDDHMVPPDNRSLNKGNAGLEDVALSGHDTLSDPEPINIHSKDPRLMDSFDDVLNDWQSYKQGIDLRDFLDNDDAPRQDSLHESPEGFSTTSPGEPVVSDIDELSFLSEINKNDEDKPMNTLGNRKENPPDEPNMEIDSENDFINDTSPKQGPSHTASEKAVDASLVEDEPGDLGQDFDSLLQNESASVSHTQGGIFNSNDEEENRTLGIGSKDFVRTAMEQEDNQEKQFYHASKSTELPNFFMPPDRLAESMQKYRLTKTNATDSTESVHSSNQHVQDDLGTRIEQEYRQRKKLYKTKETKPSLDKPPPLQTSEINRIASIFTSKFS